MQTPLNTYSFLLHTMWQKLLTFSRLKLLAGLTLLLFIASLKQGQAAVVVGSNSVIIGGSNTTINGRYYTNNVDNTAKGDFKTVTTLGTFDRGSGSLLLSARASTRQTGQDDVQTAQLFYRIYVTGTTAPTNYTALNLDAVTSSGTSTNLTKVWTASVNPPNLLTATSEGSYTLELYFQFISVNNRNFATNYFDRTSTSPYRTRFTVQGQPAANWVGTTTDWFTRSNWSTNDVPGAGTDVTITLQSGAKSYPTITGAGGRIAQVRTLRLDNSSAPNSTVLTLNSGELQVYGDFQNPNGGLKQNNGIFTLAGTTQTFDGASFTDFRIQGGGTKTLTNRMDIVNKIEFLNGGGILATNTSNADVYNVDLGINAQIVGENETSYVLGVLRAVSRVISRGSTNTFGNIGIDITASLSAPEDPGFSIVTRRTGLAYAGVGFAGTGMSVRRSFTFSAIDSPNDQVFTLGFHYLNTELSGQNTASLGFYRSASGVAPFDNLSRASNSPSTKTVVSSTITGTLAATFTLGETALPLPVTLVSFTATSTPQGAALLRWITATETNNKGFGIERQLTSSDSWQSVGYLASGNNTTGGTYEYLDKSLSIATFSRQAYYRLRQEDQDGKVSYSPVAVVSRSAMAASSELLLSPVPVTGSNISLTFAEAGQAGSEITITNTQGQRLFSQTTQASADVALSLPVERLAAGVYIVSVRVPGQAVRHARFVKL
jgi:hypothetical protein